MTAEPNQSFVPLAAGSKATAGPEYFQVLVAARPENARPLANFVSENLSKAHNAPSGECEPQVTLERAGDLITAIHIQCSCGKRIDLACAYQTEAPGHAK